MTSRAALLVTHTGRRDSTEHARTVARDLIEDLINTSRQKVRQATGRLTIPGKQTARFATRLQNTNLEDNEELIARIQLKHGD